MSTGRYKLGQGGTHTGSLRDIEEKMRREGPGKLKEHDGSELPVVLTLGGDKKAKPKDKKEGQ